MSKRLVDIDDELLDEATGVLGAKTLKETVNRSLEEVVLAARRRSHADRLESMQGPPYSSRVLTARSWAVYVDDVDFVVTAVVLDRGAAVEARCSPAHPRGARRISLEIRTPLPCRPVRCPSVTAPIAPDRL
jgi:Arc/MetJ family transcription regulator